MRALGIDYGTRTTGFAITDSCKIISSSLSSHDTRESDCSLFEFVHNIFNEYKDIDTIVLGYPLNVNGTKNERTIIVENFEQLLKKSFANINIVFHDERFTTRMATWNLKSINLKNSQIKKIKDKASAQIILQSYLEMKK